MTKQIFRPSYYFRFEICIFCLSYRFAWITLYQNVLSEVKKPMTQVQPIVVIYIIVKENDAIFILSILRTTPYISTFFSCATFLSVHSLSRYFYFVCVFSRSCGDQMVSDYSLAGVELLINNAMLTNEALCR